MCLNTPPIFEAHFAVPGVRAVLNTLNTRYPDVKKGRREGGREDAKIRMAGVQYVVLNVKVLAYSIIINFWVMTGWTRQSSRFSSGMGRAR